jgi:nucleotide-binding universal stress UspA family protein
MFRHVVFPIDFSKRCDAVCLAVCALARTAKARLTLLHAIDLPPGAYADWYSFSAMVDVDAIRRHERKLLEEFAREYTVDLTGVERVVVDGPPVASIVKFAEDQGGDLITLPTHGYGRFRSMLVGSVTQGILHDAHCPVWTAAHTESGGVPTVYRQVVCAIDLSPSTPMVLDQAQRFARCYHAELTVVHAMPPVADPVHASSAADFRRQSREEAKELYFQQSAAADVGLPCEFVEGGVSETVAAFARGREADLVICGRGVIQGTLGRLRTHVHDIIRSAPCPVLSL